MHSFFLFGVLDLELFGMALWLRLRWLWFQWRDPDGSWVGTEVLGFRVSTTLILGDGSTTKFWESTWCDGIAPRLAKEYDDQ
jgi:hypothetical protein